MPSIIVGVSEEGDLDDGGKGIEDFLGGLVVPGGNSGKWEYSLAGFGYVYYSWGFIN